MVAAHLNTFRLIWNRKINTVTTSKYLHSIFNTLHDFASYL